MSYSICKYLFIIVFVINCFLIVFMYKIISFIKSIFTKVLGHIALEFRPFTIQYIEHTIVVLCCSHSSIISRHFHTRIHHVWVVFIRLEEKICITFSFDLSSRFRHEWNTCVHWVDFVLTISCYLGDESYIIISKITWILTILWLKIRKCKLLINLIFNLIIIKPIFCHSKNILTV